MERSDKHGPRLDEDLKRDFEADEHTTGPTRAQEWRDPEPPTEEEREAPAAEEAEERSDRP